MKPLRQEIEELIKLDPMVDDKWVYLDDVLELLDKTIEEIEGMKHKLIMEGREDSLFIIDEVLAILRKDKKERVEV